MIYNLPTTCVIVSKKRGEKVDNEKSPVSSSVGFSKLAGEEKVNENELEFYSKINGNYECSREKQE
jgi:hypothetical protein